MWSSGFWLLVGVGGFLDHAVQSLSGSLDLLILQRFLLLLCESELVELPKLRRLQGWHVIEEVVIIPVGDLYGLSMIRLDKDVGLAENLMIRNHDADDCDEPLPIWQLPIDQTVHQTNPWLG